MLRNVVVVGATGRLGRALVTRCDPLSTLTASRRPNQASNETPVGDQGFLDPAALVGKNTVINCAALTNGDEADLIRVNGTLPGLLALQALEAGVRHFIQISSFRVYGRAENIDRKTETHPTSAYGLSKLIGEHRVQAIQSKDFRVTCLRLPFLFGAREETMLGSLVALLAKTSLIPIPRESPARSMSTFGDAAYLIEELTRTQTSEVVHIADPTPFTFALLRSMFRTEADRQLLLPRLPDFAVDLLGTAFPKVKQSLFTSERLSPDINFAWERNLPLGLQNELRALVRRKCGKSA